MIWFLGSTFSVWHSTSYYIRGITHSRNNDNESEFHNSNTYPKILFRSGGGGLKAQKQKGELDEQLRDYINEWRKQREKEEEELKRLKEKQAKRKEIRAEQEKKLNQQKKVWKYRQITNYDKQNTQFFK